MSLNLGPVAFSAIQSLKNSSDWQAVKGVLKEQMGKYMHAAVESGPGVHCQDACGYARAFRDLLWTIEIIEASPQQLRQKPDVPVHPLDDLVDGEGSRQAQRQQGRR